MMPATAFRSLLAALALLVPGLAASQTKAPTLDEIVARHVTARGGRDALAAIKTVRMAGHAVGSSGRHAVVRREIARPGRIRTEFVFQGTTGVYAWDGSSGWRVSPLDGGFEPEPLPADEAAASAVQADIDGPLVDWKAKGYALRLVGTDTLPGGPAYHLELEPRSGAVRELWLDAGSGLVVRTAMARKLRGHDVELETDFGDYQETAGVRFARAIESGVRGRPRRLRILVDSVETNVALDDARFKMPR
jgi:outer membrane lipoprotein-sorting protein